MKHKFKIKRVTEFDIEGNLTAEQFKVRIEIESQSDNGIYDKYRDKTFSTFAEARKYIRKHEGIWK